MNQWYWVFILFWIIIQNTSLLGCLRCFCFGNWELFRLAAIPFVLEWFVWFGLIWFTRTFSSTRRCCRLILAFLFPSKRISFFLFCFFARKILDLGSRPSMSFLQSSVILEYILKYIQHVHDMYYLFNTFSKIYLSKILQKNILFVD
jgi:hypothetical protein